MNPKITAKEAAELLKISPRQVYKRLIAEELPFHKDFWSIYFGYPTARQLFKLTTKPLAISLQIVKGGTGKTSLACALAVRANLYGLRVLCIDLDQQGNLTKSFGVDAELLPVMVDILAEGYSYEDAITRVYPGMDLLASRIENALLDEVIKLKRLKLDRVYKEPLSKLKEKYDLIVIDCPPNLGQSVAAVTLGVDKVLAPVVPENYALSGLKTTSNAIAELQELYKVKIEWGIIINKYDPRALFSLEAKQLLDGNSEYKANLLKSLVHSCIEFPNAIARGASIFDSTKASQAKRDIDGLTRELLGIGNNASNKQNNAELAKVFEESFS